MQLVKAMEAFNELLPLALHQRVEQTLSLQCWVVSKWSDGRGKWPFPIPHVHEDEQGPEC